MSRLFGRPDGSSRLGRARFAPLGFLVLALVSSEIPAAEKAACLGAGRSKDLAFGEPDTADKKFNNSGEESFFFLTVRFARQIMAHGPCPRQPLDRRDSVQSPFSEPSFFSESRCAL